MPCWRSFDQSLARIRQGRPDVSEELAWRELHVEINNALWGMSEGVPIDKFRYPRLGKMVDLVVLVRNKYLAYENIQWQKVECNLKWLEQRWPVPAHAMEPEESQPLNKSDLVDALKPATQADAGAGADAKPAAVELLGALNPDAKSEPTPPTELEPSSSELAARMRMCCPILAAAACTSINSNRFWALEGFTSIATAAADGTNSCSIC